MKIRVLFVDLGGVIVVNGAKEIGEKFEKSDGLTREMTSRIFRYIQTANRSDKEIVAYLKSESIDPETWSRFTKELYSSEMRNDELVDLLYQIKQRGILIVFTTNNSSAVTKGIQKHMIEGLADLIVNSSELQVAKPDKKFWEAAYRETRRLIPELIKEEVLVIDDSRPNCLSSEEFGFHSYVYKNEPESNKELKGMLDHET